MLAFVTHGPLPGEPRCKSEPALALTPPATPTTAEGLARAFSSAGARSVLVSHWAVASRATVALTTGAFDALARDASLGRAEALRRSALKLAGEKDTGHPFFWAPFVLVGDGGAPPRP